MFGPGCAGASGPSWKNEPGLSLQCISIAQEMAKRIRELLAGSRQAGGSRSGAREDSIAHASPPKGGEPPKSRPCPPLTEHGHELGGLQVPVAPVGAVAT